ncbi:MAG: YceI family protein [Balneolaceae bacterium]
MILAERENKIPKQEVIMKSFLTTIFIFFLAVISSYAQTDSNYVVTDKSTMKIEGTSTIHDWECEVQEMKANINFDANALNEEPMASPVNSLSLTIPVEKIESGKGGMNKKIYGALKEKKHPNIMFTLAKAELAKVDSSASDFQLNASGTLNIAGVSRDVTFPVEGQLQGDGTYKFSGEYELNMTDYEVDPPSAIFGTIKSGEMVTVSFELFVSQHIVSQ